MASQVFMYSKLFTSAFMSASVVKTCKKIKFGFSKIHEFGFSKIHGIKFAAYLSVVGNSTISHQRFSSPFVHTISDSLSWFQRSSHLGSILDHSNPNLCWPCHHLGSPLSRRSIPLPRTGYNGHDCSPIFDCIFTGKKIRTLEELQSKLTWDYMRLWRGRGQILINKNTSFLLGFICELCRAACAFCPPAMSNHNRSPWKKKSQRANYSFTILHVQITILLMEEILHHLGCIKPCK